MGSRGCNGESFRDVEKWSELVEIYVSEESDVERKALKKIFNAGVKKIHNIYCYTVSSTEQVQFK